jgi:hypothetical protein
MNSKQLFSPPHQLSRNRHDRSRLPSSGCFSSSCFSADRRQKYAKIPLALLPVLLILSLQYTKLSSLMLREQNIGETNAPAVRYMEKGAPITTTTEAFPTSFCQRWSASDAFNHTLQPFDRWHTHHPNWIVTNETDDMFCLTEIGSADTSQSYHPYIRNFLLFYANQFLSPCNLLHKATMWSSGWNADFSNMQSGLIRALHNHVPFFIEGFEGVPWHYTANKDDQSNLTCSAGDITCYFLPYHGCESIWNISSYASMLTLDSNVEILAEDNMDEFWVEPEVYGDWEWSAYLFLTRKQLWLRRAVFETTEHFRHSSNIAADSDCSVIHVRRADVVLHDELSRRYFPVADYVKMIPEEKLTNVNHYILLLTDDSNAIDEALVFFPELKWKYLDRPRFKGSSGGWENQTPSRNPANETIFILAELELVRACSVFVHGQSGFSNLIHRHVSK